MAHGLTAAGLIATVLPIFVKLCLWATLAASLGIGLRRAPPFRELILRDDGVLGVRRDPQDVEVEARIAPDTTVLPGLIVLRLRTQSGIRTLVLLRDSLDVDAYRRLRIWLTWRANADPA